jgi:phosphonoacetaldehyde hydrolase
MTPLHLKLVVLDWAGTTIDFGCFAPVAAFVEVFAAKGVAVAQAEARGPMGLHKRDHIRAMLRTENIAAKWRAATGRDWNEDDVEELYRDAAPRLLEAVGRHGELIPGVAPTVRELRHHGLKVAATTGYFRAAAERVRASAKFQGYEPDFVACPDDVPAGRPAPWMLFRCMEVLGAFPPAAVLKVGDTPADIAEGRNAGCWSVGVVYSSSEMGLGPRGASRAAPRRARTPRGARASTLPRRRRARDHRRHHRPDRAPRPRPRPQRATGEGRTAVKSR